VTMAKVTAVHLFEEFLRVSHNAQDESCFVSESVQLSYGEMLDVVQRSASWLQSLGVSKGHRISISAPNEIHAIITLASLQLGCVSATWVSRQVFFSDEYDFLITTNPQEAPDRATVIPIGEDWLALLMQSAPLLEVVSFDDELAPVRIAYSSGTTGKPKGLAFSTEALKVRMMAAERNWIKGDRFMSLIGFGSMSGVITFFQRVFSGETFYSPGGPGENASVIAQRGLTCIKASPAQLMTLLSHCETNKLTLSSLQLIQSAGSQLPEKLALKLEGFFEAEILNLYGSTETGAIAIRTGGINKPNQMGAVVPEAQVEIVGADQMVLASGTEGTVRMRTPMMPKSYVSEQSENETGFRNGWFYPGDFGTLTADGILNLAGRHKEVVNLAGVKVNLGNLDVLVGNLEAITDVCFFDLTDEFGLTYLGVAVVSEKTIPVGVIHKALEGEVPQDVVIKVVRVENLPRSASGKLIREQAKSLAGEAA
jgi:acyl-coenzyme A synthetase/AMP-(fatty) acid ligase